MDKKRVIRAGAVCFREKNGKTEWFIVKQNEDVGWEIPKMVKRKTESSARAAIRMLGEKGGMSVKVLEEAGRAGGVTTINDKTLPQRTLFYLMRLKSINGEPIGFEESEWLKYANAVRRLSSKRERKMIKEARKIYRQWKKEKQKQKGQKK